MKPYGELSIKEKAIVIADFVNMGMVDYFDEVEKKANGYYYYCGSYEVTMRYSAKNLVEEFDHYHYRDIKCFYKEHREIYEGRF